jgi:hypothetical protein
MMTQPPSNHADLKTHKNQIESTAPFYQLLLRLFLYYNLLELSSKGKKPTLFVSI